MSWSYNSPFFLLESDTRVVPDSGTQSAYVVESDMADCESMPIDIVEQSSVEGSTSDESYSGIPGISAIGLSNQSYRDEYALQ